jgi:hypothetical protein
MIFHGSIRKVAAMPATVRVESHGRFLAWAAFSPASSIRARVELKRPSVDEVFDRRLRRAIALRERLAGGGLLASDGVRLVMASRRPLRPHRRPLWRRAERARLTGTERWRRSSSAGRHHRPVPRTSDRTPARAGSKAWSRAPAG